MFKVGDKVRILAWGYSRAEGVLEDIVPNSVFPFRVNVPRGGLWMFQEDELELVEEVSDFDVVEMFDKVTQEVASSSRITGEFTMIKIGANNTFEAVVKNLIVTPVETSWSDSMKEYEEELREGEDTYYNSYEDYYDSYDEEN